MVILMGSEWKRLLKQCVIKTIFLLIKNFCFLKFCLHVSTRVLFFSLIIVPWHALIFSYFLPNKCKSRIIRIAWLNRMMISLDTKCIEQLDLFNTACEFVIGRGRDVFSDDTGHGGQLHPTSIRLLTSNLNPITNTRYLNQMSRYLNQMSQILKR